MEWWPFGLDIAGQYFIAELDRSSGLKSISTTLGNSEVRQEQTHGLAPHRAATVRVKGELVSFNVVDEVVKYRIRWWDYLDEGNVERIAREAQKRMSDDPKKKENAEKEIAYLTKNKERMRYAEFRAQGLFVGSGVIEAGCKTVIGTRLKQSGMEWSVRGANAITSLRCIFVSGRFEDYWESRVA